MLMKQTGWSWPALDQAESRGRKARREVEERNETERPTGQTRNLLPGPELTPPSDYPDEDD